MDKTEEIIKKTDEIREPCFLYQTETSRKFWKPKLKGDALIVRFGKIGTQGQTHTKTFKSPTIAEAAYRKMVCTKLAQGYKPTAKTILVLLEETAPVLHPKAIAALRVAEHINPEVADDLSGYLTACIRHGMSPTQFKRTWDQFEAGDEQLWDAFHTRPSPDEAIEWLDELSNHPSASYELPTLYEKATTDGADRFVWFDDNGFVSFVALHGDPGANAIENTVVASTDVALAAGSTPWPEELGPGTPIQSLGVTVATLLCYGTLRTGQKVTMDDTFVSDQKASQTRHATVNINGAKVREYNYDIVIKPEDRPEATVQDALNEAVKLHKQHNTDKLWRILDVVAIFIPYVDESERKPLISQVAEILSWEELKLSPVDRSTKVIILQILACYGDEDVVSAIEAFAHKASASLETNKVENQNQNLCIAAQRAIEVIRYPGGRHKHPWFHSLNSYINT